MRQTPAQFFQLVEAFLRRPKTLLRRLPLALQTVALIERRLVCAGRPRRVVAGDERGQLLLHALGDEARRAAVGDGLDLALDRRHECGAAGLDRRHGRDRRPLIDTQQ